MAAPVIPPPPPGFTLDAQGAVPPPPPGFKLDAPAAPEAVNPAAANPEAITPFGTIKGEIGDTAMFNPAAALIKSGDLLSKLSRGALEIREAIPSLVRGEPTDLLKKVRESRDFAAQPMQELEAVHPGSAQIGELATLAPLPAAAIPALAAMEEGSVGERATRAGLAFAGNKAATAAGKYLAKAPERSAALKDSNAIRDALVAQGKAEGLVFPPSASGGGAVSRTLEGVSGKAKTEQLGTVKNQPQIDRMAREELGGAALKPEALAAVRAEAYATGYKPIADLAEVAGDTKLLTGLKALAPNATGGAIKSPARGEIDEMVGAIASQGRWSGAQLIDDIQALREQSRALFSAAKRAGGDSAKTDLAHAQKQAADLLEQLAERNIIAQGGQTGAVKALREARTLIAKTHSVEDSLINGSVNSKDLRGALSGKLKLIADLADDKALGKSMAMPVAGANVPITVLDTALASAMGFGGAGLGGFAWPAARVAARYGVMSKPAQNFIRPDYDPSLFSRAATPLLQSPKAHALAGMFGWDQAGRD